MTSKPEPSQLMLPMPLGARLVEEMQHHPVEAVRDLAAQEDGEAVFDAVQYVMCQDPLGGYLHSALCAMSLPVRRPDDEFAPVIRRDGNLSLVIRPIERMQMVDGELVPTKIGVPYGVHARLVMLFIMTEAVKQRSREIYLGRSFAAWLRRMGITSTNSGGPRGSRALVQEQIDRLMSCEWTIRWDQDLSELPAPKTKGRRKAQNNSISAFSVSDMRLVNQYGGIATGEGEFVSRFVLSEPFYEALCKHSVPMNERAFAALKRSATQIDLYSFLAFRLPRIRKDEVVRLSWEGLRTHLGNDSGSMTKFRQTVRKAWETVSGVYQQARGSVDLGPKVIYLRHAPAPVDNQMVKRRDGMIELVSIREPSADEGTTTTKASLPAPVTFPPSGSIRYEAELKDIALEHGKGRDIDLIAEAFRKAVGTELRNLEGERLLFRFRRFCEDFRV